MLILDLSSVKTGSYSNQKCKQCVSISTAMIRCNLIFLNVKTCLQDTVEFNASVNQLCDTVHDPLYMLRYVLQLCINISFHEKEKYYDIKAAKSIKYKRSLTC